ncbi:MAG: aminoglycoside phosphotransferase family protein [Clostridia bacterium]|nr:aminoglycoside phosphotransferase family protein [Clostridia bacterium]
MTIKDICASFRIDGRYVGCEELSTGNINCTYQVKFIRDGEEKNYIVQKINKTVFKEPEMVMDNIVRVTHHIRSNIIKKGLSTQKFVLRAFLARDTDEPFFIDDTGDYWRCYRFIANSITYDSCEDLGIIERAGSAFGKFQKYLDGFDANSLNITIPDFHNTAKRYSALHAAVQDDKYKRVKSVKEEIDKLYAFELEACKLQKYLDEGSMPLRVTHNDTKCNNVSFDKTTGEALAVLDLDTVMPGAVAHDFGDAIRFIANTTLEDDPNVEDVSLDIDKYQAFTKGFITELKGTLTELEKQTMNLGVFAMTVELAVRFLTDYISGDKYFKTKYPGHNVDRARNQIALAEDIIKKRGQMDAILEKYI